VIVAYELETPERRRGRVFTRGEPIDESTRKEFFARFVEKDDAARIGVLEDCIAKGAVTAWAHPGIDPADVVQLYLEPFGGGEIAFACTVVSHDRLEKMLAGSACVIEGFSLQIVDTRTLSHESLDVLRTAIETWIGRVFPSLPVPAIFVMPWREPIEHVGGAVAVTKEDWVERSVKFGAREMPRGRAA